MVDIPLVLLVFISLETVIKQLQWNVKESINLHTLLDSFIYHIRSALTEELIFRGALLFILIRRFGYTLSLWSMALIFGVYHVFSYNMIGSPIVPLLYIVLSTGLMGYVLGYAYFKSGSILLPLGIHTAWNFVNSLFYQHTPYANLIFESPNFHHASELDQTIYALLLGFVAPLAILLLIRSIKWNGKTPFN